MSGWTHGRAVVDGELKFLSVSAIQKADASTNSGCLRAWWYRYCGDIKELPTPSLERGIKLHAEIEQYLKTGSRAGLSSLVLAGMHMLPEPGPDLLVEHSLVPIGKNSQEDLALAPLRVHGIAMVGKIDVLSARRINKGGMDIEETMDPENTVETMDHKSCGNLDRAKAGKDLVKEIQMAAYAEYAFLVIPGLERVRQSHLYFPVKNQPRKATALVTREEIQGTWKHATSVAVNVIDAAREKNPDKVDANTRACRAYGRDCPARSVCRAAMHNSLASFVGVTAAENLLIPFGKKPIVLGEPQDMTIAPTSIVARLAAQKAAQEAQGAPAPAVKPAALQGIAPEVASEMARLQAQEAALTAKPAPLDLLAIIAEIESYGLGFPELTGFAAGALGNLTGIVPTPRGADHYIPGAGALGNDKVSDIETLPAVLVEVKKYAASNNIAPKAEPPPPPPPPALLPPDAPPSNPLLASRGPEPVKEEKVKKAKAPKKVKETASSAEPPSSAIISMPDIEPGAPTVVTTSVDDRATLIEDTRSVAAAASAQEKLFFYVNCSPEGVPSTSFWRIVNGLTTTLSEQLQVPDFRLSDKMGYGKWKGSLAAYLREANKLGHIPPGHYVFDGAGSEIGQVVVETMREIVQMNDGVLVQGTR